VRNKADGLSISGIGTTLTRRETEIAQLVSQGLSNRAVADQLGVGEGTVKIHLHNIYRKLGISKRTGLMLSMIANGRAHDLNH
jgi:two-component system nitrate/nitrite response regulator NarL